MTQIQSAKEAFKQLSDGDELTIETNYRGKRNATIRKENKPEVDELDEHYRFGPAENCELLLFKRGDIQLTSIQSDGTLKPSGKRVIGLVNYDAEYEYQATETEDSGTTNIRD